jgi:hypothetical protein
MDGQRKSYAAASFTRVLAINEQACVRGSATPSGRRINECKPLCKKRFLLSQPVMMMHEVAGNAGCCIRSAPKPAAPKIRADC